ncbi:glutamate ABC transporter substrate-binding protein [Streptomyces sp. N2-109]|uniref:Glutamate ABC transporter substrate-binding protein n=1 Tax=Streptomyces gossypii TaxID=2883101 RepID=A0ABT2JRK3_9ACTN|nr:glutamate ABC transporter substrate-binding protein [Streptomyces gossypii]MCT2590497.1 glutamate ABC transporter substrate-binding protein [Streptomyces gossypii]
MRSRSRRIRNAGHTDRPGRTGRTAVVAGVSGLAVAAAVLVPTALASTGGDGSGGRPETRRATDGQAAAPAAAAPEREKCDNGRDPAESLPAADTAGPAVKRIQEADQLVVGVDQNSYLWGYRDPTTGTIEGFDIDLVEAVAEDLLGDKPEIVYKTIPTDQRIPAIQKGDVDMVVRTMTVNCDRIDEVAFSTAYFESGQQMLVPKKSRITGLDESVRGKRVCNAKGSTAEKLLESDDFKDLGAKQVKVANQLDCLVRIQLGEADAVLTDNALGAGQAAQDPSVKLVGEPATIEPYGVAMSLEDEDLVRRVNHVLEEYRKGGDESPWRLSYEDWLADMMDTGTDEEPEPPEPAYKPED